MTKQAGFQGFLKQNAATGTPTGTYNTVTQIGTVTAVGSSRALIDVSAHGDAWSDFLPGRQEGTEVTLTVMWDPTITTHTNMKADYDSVAVAVRYYELQHPNWASAYRFPAITSQWEIEATDGGAMEAHITFKIITPGVSAVTPS
jgi:predicted component of type VI protein secretion system